jgi:hypothetical protein
MAVGLPTKTTYANGDVFSADDINSTNGTINAFVTGGQTAGKNSIINGGMDVWQRGTSFTPNTTIYMADRWEMYVGATGTTVTRQTTSDTTNLPFIQYCMRVSRDSGNTGTNIRYLFQPMETVNSIPLAGKAVTFSFYARKGATFAGSVVAKAGTGTGTDQNPLVTYTGAATPVSGTPTLTTTWQRFTYTGTFAATATEVYVGFEWTPSGTAGATDYFEVTGVQLEVGSTATPFSRAGATIQGELAVCQRYYNTMVSGATNLMVGMAAVYNSTQAYIGVSFPVSMRTAPTLVATSGTDYYRLDRNDFFDMFNSVTIVYASNLTAMLYNASEISSTAGQAGIVRTNSASSSIAFSAEL